MRALTQNIIILVCGMVVSLLLVFFGIQPILDSLSNLHDEVRAQKTEVLTLDQQILAFKTAQSDLSKAERKSDIDQAIAKREQLVEAVKDVEAAISLTNSQHTLQIYDQNEPGFAKEAAVIPNRVGITEIPYTLNVTNDFVGLLNVLSYLEHLPHFTEVSRIDLSSETISAEGGRVIRTGKVFGSINGVFFMESGQ